MVRDDPSPGAIAHGAWMDAFFASYYAHRPVNATFIGERGHDHLLPDLSESALGDLLADGRDLLTRYEKAPRAELDGLGWAESLDRRLAAGFLRIQEWEVGSRHFQRGNPSFYTGEAVFAVMSLLLNHSGSGPERAEAAVQRMRGMDALLAQARENVRVAPALWTRRAIRECDGALAFFREGTALLAAQDGFGSAAFSAASSEAARAFAVHRAHLETELLARDSDQYAAGPEALALYVREGHFLGSSAEEIVRYAQEQMDEAEDYLRRRAHDFGAGEPAEAMARLAEAHPDAEGYLARYDEVWQEVRRVAEARALLTWPDFPIRYVPRPPWSVEAAPSLYFLYYRAPAAVNRPPVHEYLVAPLDPAAGDEAERAFLRANNDSVIKLNHVVHHGGMGHHVQNWHAYRAESRIGRVAAVDCASRIAMFCGGTMAEGWACYATDLAAEAGALTPLEQYAEVHSRVRMAARAIVDVGLHRGEMTLEQAATFYREKAGMSASAAEGEAVKNSMFPGAAMMYLMGTDAIHDLRVEMMRREGPDFDLCRFHDTFLSYGSVPVSLIADEMTKADADA